MFCDDCQRLVNIEHKNNGETLAVCDYCGFCKLITDEFTFSESKDESKKTGEGILNEPTKSKGFPKICVKCGFGESEVMIINPAKVGEPDRILFKCKQCGNVNK